MNNHNKFPLCTQLLSEFLNGKSPNTRKQYLNDFKSFCYYLGLNDIEEAVEELLTYPASQANLTVLHYKNWLQDQGVKNSTINRKISTIRSFVKTAKRIGIVNWNVEVSNIRLTRKNQVDLLSNRQISEIINSIHRVSDSSKSLRDIAIIRLIYDLAMKRSVLVTLDIDDIDLDAAKIFIEAPNGHKVAKQLPSKTLKALHKWINARGSDPGPLFINYDHANKGLRLSETSVYRIVRDIGKTVGIRLSPFDIRKKAINEVLEQAVAAGIPIEQVSSFSEHKNVESLNSYFSTQKKSINKLPKFTD